MKKRSTSPVSGVPSPVLKPVQTERQVLSGRFSSLLAQFALEPTKELEGDILALGRVLGLSRTISQHLDEALDGSE